LTSSGKDDRCGWETLSDWK